MSIIRIGKIKLLSVLTMLAVSASAPIMAYQHDSGGYKNHAGMGMGSGYGSNSGYYARPNYGYQRPAPPPMRPYYPPKRMQPYGYSRPPMPVYGYQSVPMAPATMPPRADMQNQAVSGEKVVNIQSMSFQPGNITVKAGATVTWVNRDSAPHTVTSADSGPLASGTLNRGESYSMTFEKPGVYNYYCKFHPGMRASITVE